MEQVLQLTQLSALPAAHESIDDKLFVARDEYDNVYTTSVSLAEAFGTTHNNMLTSIARVKEGNLFRALDTCFWDMTYTSKQNKQFKCVGLNFTGLTVFFLNYSGDSIKKYQYISLFKSLENKIRESYNTTVAIAQPIQPTQLTQFADYTGEQDDMQIICGLQAAYRKIQFLERMSQEQQDQIQLLGEEVESRQQAVDFMEAVNDTVTTISVRELATFINQCLKKAGAKKSDLTGQNRLFQYLQKNDFIFKPKGSAYYMLMQKAIDMDVLVLAESLCGDDKGVVHMKRVVRVTGKGQQFFCTKFLNEFNNKNGGIINGIQGHEVRSDVHDCDGPDECVGEDSAAKGA